MSAGRYTESQRRGWEAYRARHLLRASLVAEHVCADCGNKETFERKQLKERGWKRCWSRKDRGVAQQVDVCPDCVERRRLAAPCPIPKNATSRA